MIATCNPYYTQALGASTEKLTQTFILKLRHAMAHGKNYSVFVYNYPGLGSDCGVKNINVPFIRGW
jgi:hypothetical protein